VHSFLEALGRLLAAQSLLLGLNPIGREEPVGG
jgi:hypothetical protein